MATLTALRRARAGHVELEVDGRPWRMVPDEVVVRCGLHAGLMLDRDRVRLLRAELHRAEALAVAGRALAQAPLSRKRLGQRLRRRGVAPPAEGAALETLTAVGLLDDARQAEARAAALAERGWGDLAIATRLEGEGFEAPHIRQALAGLAPEGERATAFVARLGGSRRKAWGGLVRRGFSVDAVELALGPLDAESEPG